MRKIYLICALFILLIPVFAFSGDSATFINFGFSENSRYFMFGQYGIKSDHTNPFAEIYTVDVEDNTFVTDGVIKENYEVGLEAGQSGIGGLFRAYRDALPLQKEYNINHLNTGRMLYLLINGDEPKSRLNFRDFQTGNTYSVVLHQENRKTGKQIEASFFIHLTLQPKSGNKRTYTIGLPDYWRGGVASYAIKKILISPDDAALIFVIEKRYQDNSDRNIRYMVETAWIKK